MKTKLAIMILALTVFGTVVIGQAQNKDNGPYVPANGSAERKAIVDSLRGNQDVIFKVHYIKVHRGWCWIDTTPLDKQGKPTAEGGPNLLHLEGNSWKVMDLSKVPDDPNDPLGAEDASRGYVNNVIKTFPGVPRDIFPKPSH